MSAAVSSYQNSYGSSYQTQYKSSRECSTVEHNFKLPRTLPRQAMPAPDIHQLVKADSRMANIAPRDIGHHLDSIRTGYV